MKKTKQNAKKLIFSKKDAVKLKNLIIQFIIKQIS